MNIKSVLKKNTNQYKIRDLQHFTNVNKKESKFLNERFLVFLKKIILYHEN